MSKIKISVIHSGYVKALGKYNPGNPDFCEAAFNEYIDLNIEKICDFVEQAGQVKSDIVCTHEDFTNAGMLVRNFDHPGLFESAVARSCKIIRARMSELAKQFNMLIAANNMETIEGLVYNVSTLYGRDGGVIGQYRKVHLADSENWKVTPGNTFDVFKTDIGNIGFYICYDSIFPEAARSLSLNGAEILIHQTQGWSCIGGGIDQDVGEAFQRIRAVENSVYLIVAKNMQGGGSDGGRSMVVDNYGCIVAESSKSEEGLLTVEIEPDFKMHDPYHHNNFFAGVPYCKARHNLARKPWLYGTLTESNPKVLSEFPDCELHYSAADGEKAMAEWDKKPEEEKSKFHW